jgi:hypothetical protein
MRVYCKKYNTLGVLTASTYYISYGWRALYVSHFIHIFYSIFICLTILNYFHTKHFILYNIISLCKRDRPFTSCDVEFLNSCFYTAWRRLYKPKPGRPIIFNKAKRSVGRDWFPLWWTEIYTLYTYANWDVQHQTHILSLVVSV